WDHALTRAVRERQNGAARRHQRSELLNHGDERVRTHAQRREITLAARLEQWLVHLRTVRETVHQNIQLRRGKLVLHAACEPADREVTAARVATILSNVRRRVVERVVGGVERIDALKLQLAAITQLTCSVQLASP